MKKNNPKISIVIACYNAENYIRKCLDSVLNQTFQDFELICVNDGSQDTTLDILREYEKNNDKIRVFTKENGNGITAFKVGIGKVKGDYVCVIDNDDYVEENFLEELYKTITENDSDIAVCGFIREYFEDGKVLSVEMNKEDKTYNIKNDYGILMEVNTSLWNKIYKRELITKVLDFEFTTRGLGDMVNLAYLYSFVNKISFNSNALYHYSVRKGSDINSMKIEVIDSIYENLIRIRNYYKENKLDEMLEFLDGYIFLHLGISLMLRMYVGHKKEFKRIYKKNLEVLNKEFPLWNKNKYYNLKYVFKKKKNMKLHICYLFYKIRMVRFFLFMYTMITMKLKFDIKW